MQKEASFSFNFMILQNSEKVGFDQHFEQMLVEIYNI